MLVLFMVLLYYAQLRVPGLSGAGSRIASLIRRGEMHRLVTASFMHADPVHLGKICLFGLSRLVPTTVAAYGSWQCLALFVLAGLGGNLAACRFGDAGDMPVVGAAAAVLGLEGALLAMLLRNGHASAAELQRSQCSLRSSQPGT